MSGVAEISPKYLAEVASNAIRSGYKQTEVGVIPEDWSLVKLEKLTSLIIDGTHHTPTYTSFGIPFLRVTDIQGELDEADFKFISEAEHASLIKRCKPEKGDLLLSKNGTIGIPRIVTWDWDFSVFVSLALIKLKKNLLEVEYLEQFFKSDFLNLQLAQRAKQGTVTNLHLEEIRELLIPIPVNKKEQTAIANSLSDVDALVSELENLIAKKQAIKTATMQQLLTGKTRLPQFALREDGTPKGTKPSELGEIPEDWEVHALGGLCGYQNGKAQEQYFNSNYGYKVISIGNYSEFGRFIQTGTYIDRKFKNEIGRFVLGRGDLAMILNDKTAVGTIIGRVILVDEDDTYVMNQRTMRLTPKDGVNSKYLHFLINSDSVHKRIVGMAKPGTQIYVNTDDVLEFNLSMPISQDEQVAISTILSDMDAEIQALEQRLGKTRQIKQGMMQELLTGKTRLIKPSKEVIHE